MLSFILFLHVLPFMSVLDTGKYSYNFPYDHNAHPQYQTEWWYYTGHLKTVNGHRYGYELTFFKVEWPESLVKHPKGWKAKPIYLAHFAISDITKKRFYYDEKINRPIGDIAGVDKINSSYTIWNEDWKTVITNKRHKLFANSKGFKLNLSLYPLKEPVVHGIDGVSKKGKEPDNFSYYYSISRLKTIGEIIIDGKAFSCSGLSWMDHEWMNNRKYFAFAKLGWDWFSIQLSNGMDIMIYKIRDKENKGTLSGTIVYSDGRKRHLGFSDIYIKELEYWQSPSTKAVYPIKWELSILGSKIKLNISPYFKNQELNTYRSTRVIYWEGATNIFGKVGAKQVSGQGYVEMTGYTSNRE